MLNSYIISTYKFSSSLFVFFSSPIWWWGGNMHLDGLVTYEQQSTTWSPHTCVRQEGNRDLNTWVFVLKGTSKGHGVQMPCSEQECLQSDQVAQNPVCWMFPRMRHLQPGFGYCAFGFFRVRKVFTFIFSVEIFKTSGKLHKTIDTENSNCSVFLCLVYSGVKFKCFAWPQIFLLPHFP